MVLSRQHASYAVICFQSCLLAQLFFARQHSAPDSTVKVLGQLGDGQLRGQAVAGLAKSHWDGGRGPREASGNPQCQNPTADLVKKKLWCPRQRGNCSIQDFKECVKLIQVLHLEEAGCDDAVASKSKDVVKDIEMHRQRWRDEGWAILKNAVENKDLLQSVHGFVTENIDEKTRTRIQNGYQKFAPVRAVGEHPRILQFIEDLTDRKPSPFQTLNFRYGTQQKVHSDLMHFSTFPQGLMVAAWVALEDIHNDSGPLIAYPGSHKTPMMYYNDLGIDTSNTTFLRKTMGHHAYTQYEKQLEERVLSKLPPPTRVLMQAGDAFVWASNLYHGGTPVDNPNRTRVSQVTHYFLDGANSYWVPVLSDITTGDIHTRPGAGIWESTRHSK